MRRFLSASLITLALLIGAAGAAPAAHADTATDSFLNTQLPTAATPDTTYSYTPSSITSPTSASAVGPIATDTTPANDGAKTATDPNLSGGFNSIMTWIASLFAWLVGIAAITLDNAVYYTIVTMGSYVSRLTAIGVAWRVLRDAANIMLIFGFLAIGIATIIDVDWYGGGKKLLPKLLLAAVALNFSLFISEAMIDGTNLIATQFYQQINAGQPAQPISLGQTATEPISSAIMGNLGLSTLYDVNGNPNALVGNHAWIIGFMSILLFIVAAFVMFSLAFILIMRFVALIFFILLSPVGFMGMALPLMEYRAGQWWKNFLEQIVTAPVLLLLLYVALAVITDANFLTGFNASGSWLGIFNSNNFVGFAGILLSFMVAMGLLMVVVIKAKSMAAFGAGWATKTAGKMTFGATAWAGTKVIGLPSHYAARGIKTSRWAGTRTGRIAATVLDKGAKASFDVRGVTMGGGLKAINVEAGKPAEGGYKGQRERAIKSHEEYTKSIDKAFEERGVTINRKEKKQMAETKEVHEQATEAKTMAEWAKTSAKDKREAAEAEKKKLEAEIAVLEEQQKQNPYSRETNEKLEATQKKLAVSNENLVTASANFSQAANNLQEATKAESEAKKAREEAEKAPEKRMKDKKKDIKEAYAEKIGTKFTKNPIMWLVNLGMYGPGGAVAARKIKKSLEEKPVKDKFLDLAKKMAKEMEDEKEKGGTPSEEKPKEEPKA